MSIINAVDARVGCQIRTQRSSGWQGRLPDWDHAAEESANVDIRVLEL
jgi:hypothetical protein